MSGDQTKQRLLTCARDLYLEVGLPRFSLREVARRAGVSAPAVYKHFRDREALLGSVCAAGFRIFSSYLMRALAKETPRERMAESARQYLRFGLENPRDYRFIFMGDAEAFETLASASGPEGESTFQFVVDRVKECQQAKIIKKGDPLPLATSIWGFVHGLVSLRLSGQLARRGNDAEFARFYQQACVALLAGLGP
jgi:AcrR family transcriptional regulator